MKTFSQFCEESDQLDESLAAFLLAGALAMSGITTDALTLLKQTNPDLADVEVVELQKLPPQVHPNAEGFHFEDDEHVYINTQSAVYKSAQRGNHEAIVKLASIIAHEAWHVQHGADEKGAYQAQIKTLLRLRAPENVIGGVLRSMESVVGR